MCYMVTYVLPVLYFMMTKSVPIYYQWNINQIEKMKGSMENNSHNDNNNTYQRGTRKRNYKSN